MNNIECKSLKRFRLKLYFYDTGCRNAIENGCVAHWSSIFMFKHVEAVLQSQKALVDIVGKFTPKIVKMCGAETNRIRKSKPQSPKGENLMEGE